MKQASRLFDLSGRTAVVTGGASGLGLAFCEALADAGAHVLAADLNGPRLDAEVSRLQAAGLSVTGELLDVTDRAALDQAFVKFAQRHGRLDIVFANAGIDPGPGFVNFSNRQERLTDRAIENYEQERWDKVIRLSLNAVLHSIQSAARLMKPRQQGRIIITTSTAAVRVSPGVGAAYMAAKAGAVQLMRTAALELARYNVLVNAIAPGPFVTDINNGHMRNPQVQESLARLIPLHRVGQPDEIKGLALLLASDAGSFITGQQFVIDGGYTVGTVD